MKNPAVVVILVGAAMALFGLMGTITGQGDIDSYSRASRRMADKTGMPPIQDAGDFGSFVRRLGSWLLVIGLVLVGLGVWSLLKH